MNTIKKYFFTFTLLCSIFTFAAKIDGPANIRKDIKGEILFSLDDHVEVYVYEMNKNWYQISFTAFVEKDNIINGKINSNTILFNHKNERIGETKNSFSLDGNFQETSRNNWVEVIFTGYTYKGNIHQETILENAFENSIQNINLQEFIEGFDFQKHEIENYVVYTIYDLKNPWVSSDFRLILYFDLNKNLLAFANIDRKIDVKFETKSKIDRTLIFIG
ncbi:hypothetical protein [Aureivirga sp. CE67]|uniref:hypothetical protein n=1 Tax=Aureivirga sp. CE67 TaxID=1788983 RepID=UPI0018CB0FD2|nr:hypothetical protein [Aureivirga sp. CE67]